MREGWTQVSFRYDGSFAGFLTCVYESFRHFEEPMAFCGPEEDRCSIWPERPVETDPGHAKQIYRALREKASKEVQRMVTHGYLADLEGKECILWQFIRMAWDIGPGVIYWITDERVSRLDKALRAMYNEAHLLKGFTRFSDCRGLLWAQISPKNRVLPLLRPHFCDRFQMETFLIFDDVHHEALVYAQGQWAIRPVDSIQFPAADAREEDYRRLWKTFYDTVAIQSRHNPRLRQSNLPKRYWHHMTELREELAQEGLVSR